eukprot:TRINITY_DN16363_c0_g1_i2.p1 TRINITY_DN16363_c0_g1~~TRINITY_DN16363_c0_g1_i2.p1  ORF type:complete len:1072 (+),score=161.24 TRINITY_DN16363_c0_g1_i2:89-3304(+)
MSTTRPPTPRMLAAVKPRAPRTPKAATPRTMPTPRVASERRKRKGHPQQPAAPKSQRRVVIGPLVFTSDFDSGNMGSVTKCDPPRRVPGAKGTADDLPDAMYRVEPAPDCWGMSCENGYRTWFYFGVAHADASEIHKDELGVEAPGAAALEASTEPASAQDGGFPSDAASASAGGDSEDELETITLDVEDASPSKYAAPKDASPSKYAAPKDALPSDYAAPKEASIDVQAAIPAARTENAQCLSSGPDTNVVSNIWLVVGGMNNQSRLYKQGFRPWVRNVPYAPRWRRLEDDPLLPFSFQWGGDLHDAGTGFEIRWRHHLDDALCGKAGFGCKIAGVREGSPITKVAAPPVPPPEPSPPLKQLLDPGEVMRLLSEAIHEDWVARPGTGVYFHRQPLELSLEGRVVDLLTVTQDSDGCHGADGNDRLDDLPACLSLPRETPMPRLFQDRPLVFISSRVHPGETPAQYTFFGTLRFLLSDDPRAVELRHHFVFKLVPVLNPDGVARGHYRTNVRGVNLNRCYDYPLPEDHESVWTVKQVLQHWSSQGRLQFYVDLHGHATRRGCFVLANKLVGGAQAWNTTFARLLQANSPHFDLEGCDFAEEGASEKKCKDGFSKEGSGRFAVFQAFRLTHAYTLECNYNTGRFTKLISSPARLPDWAVCPGSCRPVGAVAQKGTDAQADPVPYDAGSWAQVGEAVCVSILDLYGHNCHSRLPGSRNSSVQKLMAHPSQSRGSGLAERERNCGRPRCCWPGPPLPRPASAATGHRTCPGSAAAGALNLNNDGNRSPASPSAGACRSEGGRGGNSTTTSAAPPVRDPQKSLCGTGSSVNSKTSGQRRQLQHPPQTQSPSPPPSASPPPLKQHSTGLTRRNEAALVAASSAMTVTPSMATRAGGAHTHSADSVKGYAGGGSIPFRAVSSVASVGAGVVTASRAKSAQSRSYDGGYVGGDCCGGSSARAFPSRPAQRSSSAASKATCCSNGGRGGARGTKAVSPNAGVGIDDQTVGSKYGTARVGHPPRKGVGIGRKRSCSAAADLHLSGSPSSAMSTAGEAVCANPNQRLGRGRNKAATKENQR